MDDASAIELSCLDAHSHNLDKFLDVHIKNIQALYSSLNSHNDFSNGLVEVVVGVPQGNASDLSTSRISSSVDVLTQTVSTGQSPPSVDSTEKEIKALSQQFSIIVVFVRTHLKLCHSRAEVLPVNIYCRSYYRVPPTDAGSSFPSRYGERPYRSCSLVHGFRVRTDRPGMEPCHRRCSRRGYRRLCIWPAVEEHGRDPRSIRGICVCAIFGRWDIYGIDWLAPVPFPFGPHLGHAPDCDIPGGGDHCGDGFGEHVEGIQKPQVGFCTSCFSAVPWTFL